MTQAERLPNGHVLAVINDQSAADDAVQSLAAEGIEDIQVFSGNEMTEKVDAYNEHDNLLVKLIKVIPNHLTDEQEILAQYQEEAENGRYVLAVPARDKEHAEVLHNLLEPHGAFNVRFFGTLAVTDLSLPTNPNPHEDVRQ